MLLAQPVTQEGSSQRSRTRGTAGDLASAISTTPIPAIKAVPPLNDRMAWTIVYPATDN